MRRLNKSYLLILMCLSTLIGIVYASANGWFNGRLSDAESESLIPAVYVGHGDWSHLSQVRFHDIRNGLLTVRSGQAALMAANNNSQIQYNDVTGSNNHMILTVDHSIYVWGRNTYGQLGSSTAVGQSNSGITHPTRIGLNFLESEEYVIDIQMGSNHTLLLTSMGKVYSAGMAIGLGRNLPVGRSYDENFAQVDFGQSVFIVDISAGHNTSIALTDNGLVYTWGDNTYFQMATTGITSRNLPALVTNLGAGLIGLSVHAGYQHMAVVVKTISQSYASNVVLWGRNEVGQIGASTTTVSTPTTFSALTGLNNIKVVNYFGNHRTSYLIFYSGVDSSGMGGTFNLYATGFQNVGQTSVTAQAGSQWQAHKDLPGLILNNRSPIIDIQASDINFIILLENGEMFVRGSSAHWALGLPNPVTSGNVAGNNAWYGRPSVDTGNWEVIEPSGARLLRIPHIPSNDVAGMSVAGNNTIVWTKTGVLYIAGQGDNYSLGDNILGGNSGQKRGNNAAEIGFQAMDFFHYEIIRIVTRAEGVAIILSDRYMPLAVPGTSIMMTNGHPVWFVSNDFSNPSLVHDVNAIIFPDGQTEMIAGEKWSQHLAEIVSVGGTWTNSFIVPPTGFNVYVHRVPTALNPPANYR